MTNLPFASWKEIPSWLLVPLLTTELSVTITLHATKESEFLPDGTKGWNSSHWDNN